MSYLTGKKSASGVSRFNFKATAGQTEVSLVGQLDPRTTTVFKNGVRLYDTDFNCTVDKITFVEPLSLDDEIIIESVSEIVLTGDVASATNSVNAYFNRYYGPLASDPLTRPDGTARQKGDEYFNTVDNKRKVWNGTAWEWFNGVSSSDLSAADGSSLVGFAQPYNGAVDRTLQGRLRESVSVKDFGAVGNGSADDTTAIQAAIDYASTVYGKTVFIPRGLYKVTDTLTISNRSTRIVGDGMGRGDTTTKGTEISFVGVTGELFLIGEDDGQPWNANLYNGKQGFVLEDISLINRSASRIQPLNTRASATYAPDSYGIRDWRGGHILLRNVGIEGFEYNFWGVESDFNRFENVMSLYSKHGVYVGPRSDQFSFYDLYSFYCDRAVTIDGADGVNLYSPKLVACGSTTDSAVWVKAGTGVVRLYQPWFEGYSVVPDVTAFCTVGVEDGYGGNTTNATSFIVEHPTIATNTSGTGNGYVKYTALVGRVDTLIIENPVAARGISLATNLKCIVGFASGFDHTTVGSRAFLTSHGNYLGTTRLYENLGTGTPGVYVQQGYGGSSDVANPAGRLTIRRVGGAIGADQLRIGTENTPGQVMMQTVGYVGGQPTRLLLKKSIQHSNIAPTTGTWEVGDIVFNIAPASGGFIGWVCVGAGTPGTWKTWGAISA